MKDHVLVSVRLLAVFTLRVGLAYPEVDEAKKALAGLLEEVARKHITVVDWAQKEDVQRELRRDLKRQLVAAGYATEERDPLALRIVELLKARQGR